MTPIFFIVEGPRLEAQAALLIATLRHHNADRYPLIAYTPEASLTDLSPAIRALFDRFDVDSRALPALRDTRAAGDLGRADWRRPYPHGNKILACAAGRGTDWSLFLDTDMICTAPLDLTALQVPGQVALVPEGVPSWGKEGDRWPRAYAHFGLPLPGARVTLTRRRRIAFHPYFNSGFVLFPETPLPKESRRFGELWLDTALDFDWNAGLGGKRPWLDQITLPLTLARFGYGYTLAPVEVNFSISDRAYEPEARPTLMHYHRWAYLGAWPQHRAALAMLEHGAGPALWGRLRDSYGAIFAEMAGAGAASP